MQLTHRDYIPLYDEVERVAHHEITFAILKSPAL